MIHRRHNACEVVRARKRRFLDVEEWLQELSAAREGLFAAVDFTIFSGELNVALRRSDETPPWLKAKARQKHSQARSKSTRSRLKRNPGSKLATPDDDRLPRATAFATSSEQNLIGFIRSARESGSG